MTDNSFKLKFDGQHHQIDADTLIASLHHTTQIVHEINRSLDSGKKITVKVNALSEGSFLVHIELQTLIDAVASLFTKENISLASDIINTFVALILLKLEIKGRKTKSVETIDNSVQITFTDNSTHTVNKTVYNISKNPVVRDGIAHAFDSINNDQSVEGFHIIDRDENPILSVPREQFAELSMQSEEISNDEKIILKAATLHIVRLSFETSLKWDFYYLGNKISAKIKDPNFYTLIDKGESFAKGDTLEVELETKQKWDQSVNTFVNISHQVTRIIRHIPRKEQQRLDFEQ